MPAVPICAVLLAGERQGGDPFAAAQGVPAKALIAVAGRPMLARVVERLSGHPAIGQVTIYAAHLPLLQDACPDPALVWQQSGPSIAATLAPLLADPDTRYPLLVTTADNVLLSDAMLDQFTAQARGADVAVGVVEARVLLAKFPQSRRTWLTFRGGRYSGANLFWFGSARAARVVELWASVEQDRKRGWKMLGVLGWANLLLAAARLISIHTLAARVGGKLGLQARVVEMAQPEACIDVDKQSDLDLAEILLKSN
jgi:GTP:adenosylcobinamide-phosphate guanylyltransferase